MRDGNGDCGDDNDGDHRDGDSDDGENADGRKDEGKERDEGEGGSAEAVILETRADQASTIIDELFTYSAQPFSPPVLPSLEHHEAAERTAQRNCVCGDSIRHEPV